MFWTFKDVGPWFESELLGKVEYDETKSEKPSLMAQSFRVVYISIELCRDTEWDEKGMKSQDG